ncbi:S-layer homology domain-containing protein [Agathobaculum sp.]|uniref:S-layer homology domain-containing protein n=1 Tax=Agathobaculum sp. TaxID=2048138 RepID=UPI003AB213FD
MRAVEDHRSTTSPCYLAYAVTNGGTFKENPTSNTALATPVKAGYTFAGWYSSSDFAEGTKLTDNNQPVTGTTYYAKWTEKATPAIAIKATPSTLTGGGSVELTVSGVPTEGLLAVTCDNDITVTEKDGKYTAQLPNATKNYTFTAKYTGTDNYNDVEKTCVVKVTRKSSHSSSSGSSTTPTNTVSASTASNGKVALNKNTAKKGDTVTVTVTPDAGYQLDKLTVTDAKGKTVDVTKKSDGKYTFTMPDSKVTITPTFSKIEDTKPSKNGFDDVASSDWFADAVKYVADKGLMSGTGSDKFAPSATTTRAMLMTILARYAGEDTTGGATWYEKGMEWAKAKGVSDGTNPNASITREQLVTMLYRYAGSPKADGKLDSFSDSASVSTYAADAMQWAVANGIVNGSNGKLNPQNNATRAEVAAILMRFCEMSK